MATVRTIIHGKEYTLGCDDGQEQQLLNLADTLDKRCRQLSQHLGRVPEALMLIYASLTFIDEANEARKQAGALSASVNAHGDDAALHAVQEDIAGHLSALAQKIEKIARDLENAA